MAIDSALTQDQAAPVLHRTRVKICGITQPDDAQLVAEAGADALGLVFYEPSRRAVSVEQAREIAINTPVFVSKVGLFVNPSEQLVRSVLERVQLDVLQFHGDEAPEFAEQFKLPYIAVLRVGTDRLHIKAEQHRNAQALLYDKYDPTTVGGGGQRFDWKQFNPHGRRAILAGGLTVDNVGEAIATTRPYAVDVSSGVEDSPGHKSCSLIRRFIAACHAADQRLMKE